MYHAPLLLKLLGANLHLNSELKGESVGLGLVLTLTKILELVGRAGWDGMNFIVPVQVQQSCTEMRH